MHVEAVLIGNWFNEPGIFLRVRGTAGVALSCCMSSPSCDATRPCRDSPSVGKRTAVRESRNVRLVVDLIFNKILPDSTNLTRLRRRQLFICA